MSTGMILKIVELFYTLSMDDAVLIKRNVSKWPLRRLYYKILEFKNIQVLLLFNAK